MMYESKELCLHFEYWSFYSFNKYLLNTYYSAGSALGQYMLK